MTNTVYGNLTLVLVNYQPYIIQIEHASVGAVVSVAQIQVVGDGDGETADCSVILFVVDPTRIGSELRFVDRATGTDWRTRGQTTRQVWVLQRNCKFEIGPAAKLGIGPTAKRDLGPTAKRDLDPAAKIDLGPTAKIDVGPAEKIDLGPGAKAIWVLQRKAQRDVGLPVKTKENVSNLF